MSHFRAENRLSRVPEMISTDLDNETVLMSVEAGFYYGLEGSAQSIWKALETQITFSELIDRLTQEYEVTPEACSADVEKFLLKMQKEGLLRVE
jgi:hypothetical protein